MILALTMGYLCPDQPFNGIVHSVFRRSVNITTDLKETPWVSLLDDTLPATPTAYQCNFRSQKDLTTIINVGDKVFMRGGVIRICSSSAQAINTLAATNWSQAPPLSLINKKRIKNNILIAEEILTKHVSEKEKQPLHSVCKYIQHLGLITPICIYSFPEQITENIGYGKGLTPSGDDFLLGVLAVLSGLSQIHLEAATAYQRFQLHVPQNISKTTDISAHYLSLALSRHFSKPVQWLVYYLFTATDRPTMEAAITTNLNIGSSSGADTIAGIVYCINELLLS
ncbi:DUF2877 domain-containing protein [Photobacterium makurazakiensis]|uniref:DUF2877 domain-containing protein n=1 Tax=Photobacterium makurazakiensis TaxID=2910234 RepID=UPI003D13BFEC